MSSQPSPNIDALISGLSSTSLSSSPRHSGDSGSGISTNTAESVDEIGELDEQREDGGVEVVGKDVSTTSGEEGGDKLIGYTKGLHAYTKKLYIDARYKHERLEKERARGGKVGTSGIERMGQRNAAQQKSKPISTDAK